MDIKFTREVRNYLYWFTFVDDDEVTMAVQDFFFPDAWTDWEEPSYGEIAECQEVAKQFLDYKDKRRRRWVYGVKMIWHWDHADPELEYDWTIANYWTVENTLYEDFIDWLKEDKQYNRYCTMSDMRKEEEFNDWLFDNRYKIVDIFIQLRDLNEH